MILQLSSQLTGKDRDAERLEAKEKRKTEEEMAGWHHRLSGHEFEQALGDDEGQGSLVRCSLGDVRVQRDLATEQLHHRYLCQ